MISRPVMLRQCRRAFWSNASRAHQHQVQHAPNHRHQPNLQSKRGLATEVEATSAASSLSEEVQHTQSISLGLSQKTSESDDLPQLYHTSLHIASTTGHLGTDVSPAYQPRDIVINPPRPSDVTLELLLASQAHMGHSTALWNPMNSRYIFGIREGIHIMSLEVIAAHLRRAARIVSGVAERAGIILFVGTRPGQRRCVVRAAELSGGYHLFERWMPGTITNGEKILAKCGRKYVDGLDREIPGLDDQIGAGSVVKPDLVVCLNTVDNGVMLHECALANIPTIGIIDTDTNPTWVTYPIPANDDSLRCTELIAGVLGRAGEEGKAKRLAANAAASVASQRVESLTDITEKEPNQRPAVDQLTDEDDLFGGGAASGPRSTRRRAGADGGDIQSGPSSLRGPSNARGQRKGRR